MRRVRVRLLGYSEYATSGGEIRLDVGGGHNVEDLLEELADKYKLEIWDPSRVRSTPYVMILVNVVSIENLNGLKTELNDDDMVAVIQPVEGG